VHDAAVIHGTPDTQATALLARYWVTPEGTYPLPVDPIYLVRQLGTEVYLSDLAPGVSAVLVASPGQQTGIYLSRADAKVRQRFSCAHEVGHYLRRRASGQEQFGFVDRRDHFSATGTDPRGALGEPVRRCPAHARPIEPRNINRAFTPLLCKAGLRPIRLHDLRHSCATLLFAQGVEAATVQRILGHSSITVTTSTYVDVIEQVQHDALSKLDGLFDEDDESSE
jgi:hypothetical protein